MHQKRLLLQQAEAFLRASQDALYGDETSEHVTPAGEGH